jgi:hypothetical protein
MVFPLSIEAVPVYTFKDELKFHQVVRVAYMLSEWNALRRNTGKSAS